MRRKRYVIIVFILLGLLTFAIKVYVNKMHINEVLSNVLYIGVMNRNTGEYIYISEKSDIDKVVKVINSNYKEENTKEIGNSYSINIFSTTKPGDNISYNIQGNYADMVILLGDFYKDSSRYKKDRIYLANSDESNQGYSIKFRYSANGEFPSSNPIIDIKDFDTVEKMLNSLKEVKYIYNKSKQPEGMQKGWVQLYYKNKQVECIEFDGSKVVRSDWEYVVENVDVVSKIYSLMEKLIKNK